MRGRNREKVEEEEEIGRRREENYRERKKRESSRGVFWIGRTEGTVEDIQSDKLVEGKVSSRRMTYVKMKK